ncbi:MAG: hypothetical protein PW843_14220 [Azospirillaceae bacterium]|nr:hypothetical protein [Azospirillaceae bacterium]
MSELSKARAIWFRAAESELASFKPGDWALDLMMEFHGLIMNGGVFHAIEHYEPDEVEDALAAYQYFGLGDAVDLFNEAKAALDSGEDLGPWEEKLDGRYYATFTDELLFERFEAMLQRNPSEFTPT